MIGKRGEGVDPNGVRVNGRPESKGGGVVRAEIDGMEPLAAGLICDLRAVEPPAPLCAPFPRSCKGAAATRRLVDCHRVPVGEELTGPDKRR